MKSKIPPKPPPSPRSKVPFIISGVAVYSLSLYTAYLYTSLSTLPDSAADTSTTTNQPDKSSTFDSLAPTYDRTIWLSELLMGMPLLRRSLARSARGHVLEVSSGTGRNNRYYDIAKCRSITFVDCSREMLSVGQKNFYKHHPKYRHAKFLVQDAATPLPQKYDTIVQSMGVCSHHSPETLLRNLSAHIAPGGRVVLLEHGRSHYEVVNWVLDRLAGGHAERWGCWWNRDVGALVGQSGMRVVRVSRYHLGTTWWVEMEAAGRF